MAFLPPEELEARQVARFQAMVHHAWKNVPFYRRWLQAAAAEPGDLKTARDLSKLPLIGKLTSIEDPCPLSAQNMDDQDGLTLVTSGTSGIRSSIRYDVRSLFRALAAGRRQRLALVPFVGRETGYREAVVKNLGTSNDQMRTFWEERMLRLHRLDLQRCNISPHLHFEQILARLNEFRPDVIRGIGSQIGAFLRWVHEGGRKFHTPKAITYGADAMPAPDRQLIEEGLRIPVVSSYQASEALRIGFQCEVRRGFHISTDMVAFRVVDTAGRDVAPGERGEFIVSNLTNRATVILNYRIGDLVTLGKGPCPCGRTLPLIEAIDGRLDDLLVRTDGTFVHALSVVPRLQRVPGVNQIQLVQTSLEDYRLRVVWSGNQPGDCAELRTLMASVLGPQIRVEFEQVDHLQREASGKVRTAISEVSRR